MSHEVEVELAMVCSLEPDSMMIRSAAANLIEQGIHFTMDHQQTPLRQAPDDLSPYRAVMFDELAFHETIADAERRRRLEGYARAGGFVFVLPSSLRGEAVDKACADVLCLQHVHDIRIHAGLTSPHRRFIELQMARCDQDIFAALKADILHWLQNTRSWGEYTQNYWKSAMALIDAGFEELRQPLIDAIRQTAEQMRIPIHHDIVSGYFGTVWLREQTGEDQPLQRAKAMMDRVLIQRPKFDDIATGTGFLDDPLGLEQLAVRGGRSMFYGNLTRRRTIWNELLHMHGPSLAALAAGTGDRRYLQQAIPLVNHIAERHVRCDNLLSHFSREGQPMGAAWARGHAHALYGLLYMLDYLEPQQPPFNRVVELIDRVGQGLLVHQDRTTGLWRNVIDHPDARLESTGTNAFLCVYSRCVRKGWLPRQRYESMLEQAWRGLKRLYWRGGFAAHCRGTATGDLSYYLGRPQGWGVLPQLAAGMIELSELGMIEIERPRSAS
jgi:hypothetical protein